MKKLLIIISLLLFTPFVKAEDITYELCKSGCEYSDINDVYTAIIELDNTKVYTITIDIKDEETYPISRYTMNHNSISGEKEKSLLLIKGSNGHHPKISNENLYDGSMFIPTEKIEIENVDIESVNYILINTASETDGYLKIKNSTITGKSIDMGSPDIQIEDLEITSSIISFYVRDKSTSQNVIKNTKIKIDQPSELLSINLNGNFKVENSELETPGIISPQELYLVDSIFKGDVSVNGKQTYRNSKIEGTIKASNEIIDFDNVEVTNGIEIGRGYCNLNEEYNGKGESIIKNSKISNSFGNAVTLGTRDSYSLKIENSDLNDSTCSVVAYVPEIRSCPDANTTNNKLLPKYLKNKKPLSIEVSNSKVNCAYTYSNDLNKDAMDLFFDYKNEWKNPVVRFQEFEDDGNVLERNNGNIFIEHGSDATLVLKVDKDKLITDYFKNIVANPELLGDWFIEDESIVKMDNNKLTPLKVGKTSISSAINNDTYVLNVSVVDKEGQAENPNTTAGITRLVILTLIMGIIALVLYIKRPKIRIE